MNSIDTNIILRFLLNDIPSQTIRAQKLITKEPVYISDVILTEAVFVLERTLNYDRSFIAGMFRAFLGLSGVMHNDHLVPDVLDMYERRKALSFVDCYAAVEAAAFGTTLYTFDKKLLSQGGSHVLAP